jgi:hypothetical protein
VVGGSDLPPTAEQRPSEGVRAIFLWYGCLNPSLGTSRLVFDSGPKETLHTFTIQI